MTRATFNTSTIPTTKVVAIGYMFFLIITVLSSLTTTTVTAFQIHDGLHHGGGNGGSTKSEQQQQHSRRSRLVIHPKQQINHDEEHPPSSAAAIKKKTTNDSSGFGSVVGLYDRAKECAQHKGECSLQEVQDLKDGLHRERLQNYMIYGSPSMENVLLEEELNVQLKLYQDLLQTEETTTLSSSSSLPTRHHQQLFPSEEEDQQKEDIYLDEFMKELQPHLKDLDDGNHRLHRRSGSIASPSSLQSSSSSSSSSSRTLTRQLDNADWFRPVREMMMMPLWSDESETMIVMKESIFICFIIAAGLFWTPATMPS